MTYLKLLEIITEMSEEQKNMDVVICVDGVNVCPLMLTQVVHNDDEEEDALPLGQPILV